LKEEPAVRHQLHPSVDELENLTLMSHMAASLVAHDLHYRELLHDVQRVQGMSGMTVALTTNQGTYNLGQVVKMTMTMTNISNHNETVVIGPSTGVFVITHNQRVIWRSNEGVVPQIIVKRILKPEQSITLTAHWTATATGGFVVHDALVPAGPVATFQVTPTPGSRTPIEPTPIEPRRIEPRPISPPTSLNPMPMN
jgi:hypothetical protein